MSIKSAVFVAASLAATLACATAQAGVRLSVGVDLPGPAVVAAPYPVAVAAPRRVYPRPAPVYVAPAPVYVAAGYPAAGYAAGYAHGYAPAYAAAPVVVYRPSRVVRPVVVRVYGGHGYHGHHGYHGYRHGWR